jgi:hypothetical protein
MYQLDYDPLDYREKGLKLVLDYLIGFIKYTNNGDMSDEQLKRYAHRFILNIEYEWNSNYGGLRYDKVVFAKIESARPYRDDLTPVNFPSLTNITGSYIFHSHMFAEPTFCNILLNINHCIYVNIRILDKTAYTFQRYIEKDFGISRYIIDNLNDIDEALENGETEWLNVLIDYINNNKLWLETMLTKLDDKPQYVELKTKVIRQLNKLNNESGDIGL